MISEYWELYEFNLDMVFLITKNVITLMESIKSSLDKAFS